MNVNKREEIDMNPFSILMFVFAIGIFLGGLSVFNGNTFLLYKTYHKKPPVKSELRYIGRVTMLVSLAPVFSGLVALIGDEEIMFLPASVTLIISFILLLIIGIKIFKSEK